MQEKLILHQNAFMEEYRRLPDGVENNKRCPN